MRQYTLTAGSGGGSGRVNYSVKVGVLWWEPKGSILLVYFVADESGSMGTQYL